MLITKDFVMLNLPKTGSTFARTVIKQLYRNKNKNLIQKAACKLGLITPELIELNLPNIKMPTSNKDQHGTFYQIPIEHKNKIIVSVLRNPYSRFLSLYQFKSWANPNQLTVDKSIIDREFPSFPNLSIDDFVELCLLGEKTRLNYLGNPKIEALEIGEQTLQFIQMFFKNPIENIKRIDENYFISKAYKNDMCSMTFLKQESLNEDLIRFLSQFNLKQDELSFIKDFRKVNVTKSKALRKDELWTQKAIEYVKYRERFLFLIFKDFGIDYELK